MSFSNNPFPGNQSFQHHQQTGSFNQFSSDTVPSQFLFQQQQQQQQQFQAMPMQYQQNDNRTFQTQQPQVIGNTDQLSFLSPSDQVKFQNLFDSATDGISISPEAARLILLKSNLTPHNLARIWELSDINKTGDLLFPEFALALHLCNVVLRGGELPLQLDPQIRQEVSNYVDKISFNLPENSGSVTQSNNHTLRSSNTNDILELQPVTTDIKQNLTTNFDVYGSQRIEPQHTSFAQSNNFSQLNNLQTGGPVNDASQSVTFQPTGNKFLNYQATGISNNIKAQAYNPQQPLETQATGFTSSNYNPNEVKENPTGLAPLKPQATTTTGINGLSYQQTGNFPIQSQATGLIPLGTQQTGLVPLPRQPTGLIPLQSQATGSVKPLTQQPTGLVPLPTQTTGTKPLNRQPTGLIPLPTGGKLTQSVTGGALQAQQTGLVPLNSVAQPLAQQPTGLVPLQSVQTGSMGLYPQKTGLGAFEPLKQQKTGVGQNSFFLSNLLQETAPTFTNSLNYTTETITPQEKELFNKIFQNYDVARKGVISADVSAEIFRKSGLNREELEKVWDLIIQPNQTSLDKESFQTGMWLIYKRLNGYDLPDFLPESLKSSSLKILDSVKQQLKINSDTQRIKKSSNSKIDGSRFKNNDDEIIQSSSRHRRRTTTKNAVDSRGSSSVGISSEIDKLTTDELKKKIWEKKILLEALQDGNETLMEESISHEAEDLRVIEDLKAKLMNLTPTSASEAERLSLRNRFETITAKIPYILTQISEAGNDITNLKLELFKLKNPSTMLGSGPNGEITEADKRKAKSKALLAIKMAKLTGKPIDPEIEALTHEQNKLGEEVLKIQEENKSNQKSINDIRDSIDELSKGIQSALSGSKTDNDDYKKWELGLGLQPEVQEIVKQLKANEITNKFQEFKVETNTPENTSTPSPSKTISSPVPQLKSFSSAEERKAYIREQAKNKMNERLAKLGISRSTPKRAETAIAPPKTVISPHVESHQSISLNLNPNENKEEKDSDSSSDDDDDEEFERMEEIRRLKRLERDARLAELGAEEATAEQNNTDGAAKFHKSNPFAF